MSGQRKQRARVESQTRTRPRGSRRAWYPALLAVFALLASGCQIWAWGDNSLGSVGNGTTLDQSTPVEISPEDFGQVDGIDATYCGIRTVGSLWCWGRNDLGQVGDGTTTDARVPVQVGTSTLWSQVAVGTAHGCAIRLDGTLWCWGSDHAGQLGNGPGVGDEPSPVQVGSATDWVTVAAGRNTTCGIRGGAGNLWCWGTFPQLLRPLPELQAQTGWTEVSAGSEGFQDEVCAIRAPGELWCGTGAPTSREDLSTQWTAVDTGLDHHCGIRDGEARCWGDNGYGQIGDGTTIDRLDPTVVAGGHEWSSISVGPTHTCGVRTNGRAMCWGQNDGRFGNGTFPDWLTPVQIGTMTNWVDLSAGLDGTCGLRANGAAWCTGSNFHGQRGDGSGVSSSLSYRPVGFPRNHKHAAAGRDFSCSVSTDGALWCWGANTLGQVGDGSTTNRLRPARVGDGYSWTRVESGDNHSCATRTDGSLWCWGANGSGQVGKGASGSPQLTPIQIGTASWRRVSGGGDTSCGVQTAGSLWCWGSGFGTSPSQVGGDLDWADLSVGPDHRCARKVDNSLHCWGDNAFGQLGLGDTTTRAAPTSVGGSWSSVAAGSLFTCGIQTDSTLHCWGWGFNGQLGHGNTASQTSPLQVGVATWQTVSAGGTHTCGAQTNNRIYCWGGNSQGQVGDGTTTNRTAPVVVTSIGQDFRRVATGRDHTIAFPVALEL